MKSNEGVHVLVGRKSNSRFWIGLIIFALVSPMIGMYGINQQYPGDGLFNKYRLLALFMVDIDFAEATNLPLRWARFMAPTATIAALIWVLVETAREFAILTRLRRFPPSVVVIGSGGVS